MLEKEYTMADYIESLKEDIRKRALEEGREEGIKNLIVTLKSLNIDKDNTLSKIIEIYHIPSDRAEAYLRKYLAD